MSHIQLIILLLIILLSSVLLSFIMPFKMLFDLIYKIKVVRNGGKNRINKRGKGLISITFDDGPDPLYTFQILKILKKYKAKATFFICGKNLCLYPELGRIIIKEGHEIENHSFSHDNLIFKNKKKILEEIIDTDKQIQALTGIKPHFFRPPHGLRGPALLNILKAEGYELALWSSMPFDWLSPGEKLIRFFAKRGLKPGKIMVLHDGNGNRAQTVAVLEKILEDAQKAELSCVTLKELVL